MQVMTNTVEDTRTKRITDRLQEIKQQLAYYRDSIELIKAFLARRETLKGKDYTYLASCSSQTPDDKARGRWTLQHIQMRIIVLEHEYRALEKFSF